MAMTYRERREAKAERYREWADKRDAKGDASYQASRDAVAHIPLGQPVLVGHHSERGHRADLKRAERAMDRSVENWSKAKEFRSRADNIEKQAKRSIYSDDEDAVDRLREKLEKMEAQRERMKAANAAYRKEHKEELKGMSVYQKDQVMPAPKWALANLGGNISRTKKRIEQLSANEGQGVGKVMTSRYDGECSECGAATAKGETITYYRRTKSVVCEECSS